MIFFFADEFCNLCCCRRRARLKLYGPSEVAEFLQWRRALILRPSHLGPFLFLQMDGWWSSSPFFFCSIRLRDSLVPCRRIAAPSSPPSWSAPPTSAAHLMQCQILLNAVFFFFFTVFAAQMAGW